jgi:hypothetical protein
MLGGINNGLFLSSFGGFFALAFFTLILKWAFGNRIKDKGFVVTPDKAGKKDQYGLLVALPTPKNYIEAEILRQKLLAADIRVNLTQTFDGPALMVFERDFKIAQAVLKS